MLTQAGGPGTGSCLWLWPRLALAMGATGFDYDLMGAWAPRSEADPGSRIPLKDFTSHALTP